MSKGDKPSAPKTIQAPAKLPLRMVNWEGVVPQYVTNISVTGAKTGETIVTLGSAAPPPVMTQDDWAGVGFVPVQCIGRFIFSPSQLEAIINVLLDIQDRMAAAGGKISAPEPIETSD